MGTIFSNTLETVAPIKLKKVREKHAAPWYNSYTHSLKIETRNLSRKMRKTNLEVFRIAWKNSMSSYRQALKTARTEHIHKLIDNNQNNPRFLFSTLARLTNKQIQIKLRLALFITYTIIQGIMRSEMCSLHLTHPSAHTHLEQWAADIAAPGEQLGVWCHAQGSHLSRGHFLPEPGFKPTTLGYLRFQVQRSIH